MDSQAISTGPSPSPQARRRYRSQSRVSCSRGNQPAGWNGLMNAFHERTSSNSVRSESNPAMRSSGVPTSGAGEVSLTTSSRRCSARGPNWPARIAAVTVAAAYWEAAKKSWVERMADIRRGLRRRRRG